MEFLTKHIDRFEKAYYVAEIVKKELKVDSIDLDDLADIIETALYEVETDNEEEQ